MKYKYKFTIPKALTDYKFHHTNTTCILTTQHNELNNTLKADIIKQTTPIMNLINNSYNIKVYNPVNSYLHIHVNSFLSLLTFVHHLSDV